MLGPASSQAVMGLARGILIHSLRQLQMQCPPVSYLTFHLLDAGYALNICRSPAHCC